jgi:hypothetical protein
VIPCLLHKLPVTRPNQIRAIDITHFPIAIPAESLRLRDGHSAVTVRNERSPGVPDVRTGES